MQTRGEKTQGWLGAYLRAVGTTLLEGLARVADVMIGPRPGHELDEAAKSRRDAE